ncbi:CU044_5270 family protein [Thermomonospora umbrina]|uniref:CU044_5270 family protein n=1 Tax=Thermomonospora umbrina TaxID=111806 RepID=A0A3D9T4L8_9ACTN|nr:CU044_5270 family protein [Thermomonospora umbrina]REE99644.1 hypothetical protein DFJ69_5158 [Thermomonospora umbrina]
MTSGAHVEPDETFAALKPAALETLADDGHHRRREHDLAHAMTAEPRTLVRRRARRRPSLLLAGLAGGAVVAAGGVAVTGGDDATTPPAVVAGPVDARSFLLASARTAERAPSTTGAYWYSRVREQRIVRTLVDKLSPGERPPKGWRPTRKDLPFTAYVTTSQDTWHGADRRSRARTVIGLDRRVTFRSPADEAAWRRSGAPELEEWSARPRTNDYDFRHTPLTENQQRSAPGALAEAPTDVAGLERLLRAWHRADDREAIAHDGVPTGMTFTETVFYEASNLLSGAARPGTRAAFYRLLAAQPGITMVGEVTDLLGRKGTALSMRSPDGEQRLIIDPGTARLLAHEAHHQVSPGGGTVRLLAQAVQAEGWVNAIGERP